MNTKINSILIFFCLLPVWYFKFQIYKISILFFLCFFFTIFLLSLFLVEISKKKKNLQFILLSIIIFFGFDNHLSLHRELTNSISFLAKFGGIYVSSIILALLICFIIFVLLKIAKEKAIQIITITIFTLAIYSLIDNSKNINNLKTFKKETNNITLPTVILIFDEMSGLNSYESKTKEGINFDKKLLQIAEKNNLTIYENILSSNKSTLSSIGSLLNLSTEIDLDNIIKQENNFFYNNSIVKNNLFNKFKQISVFQSVHLNYCNNKNVKKCNNFNPFEEKKYIDGFKNNQLTHLINAWKLDGSITSLIIWRAFRQVGIIDVTISPQGEKASFEFFFNSIIEDMKSQKYELIFGHTLVPHKPYGFTENCIYDGKRSLGNYNKSMNIEQHTLFHNIDRTCVLTFIDRFLKKIKKENIEYKKILFLSDHGSRNLMNDPSSSLNVIFFIKEFLGKYNKISDLSILQEEFKKQF